MTKSHSRRSGAPVHAMVFEPLEARALLSADLLPFAAELQIAAPTPAAEFRDVYAQATAYELATTREHAGTRELMIVSTGIADEEGLVASLRRDGVDVVVLDARRDALTQISELLATYHDLEAVHLISHAQAGALQLGTTQLDAATLSARSVDIARWSDAFSADGDLLIYGCDFAADDAGRALVDRLALLTGADVAASTDRTGTALQGGDWTLEYRAGTIETPTLFSATWEGVLGATTVDWDTVSWPGGSLVNDINVGGIGTIRVTVSGDTGTLYPGYPTINSGFEGGLGPGDGSLRIQTSSGLDPGTLGPAQSLDVRFDFNFVNPIASVSFTIFDIDIDSSGTGFTDQVRVTADNGALNPSSVVLGNDTVSGWGTGTSYNTFDGVNTVTGVQSAQAFEPYANAAFTFSSGVTSIDIHYTNVGSISQQGIAIHDLSFDFAPRNNVPAATLSTLEDTAFAFTGANTISVSDGDGNLSSVALSADAGVLGVTLAPGVTIASGTNGSGALTLNGTQTALNDTLATLVYTPALNAIAAASLTITSSDGTYSATNVVSIGIISVNDAPSLTLGAAPVVAENSGPQVVPGFATATPGGGPDEAGQTFTYFVSNSQGGLFATQPSISSDGTLTFTPSLNASGIATVTVSVRDSGGTANGGIDTSGTQSFLITVNNAPVLAGANPFTGILEDAGPNPGMLVSDLIAGQVSDADAGALTGIAITAADGSNGSWQFSTDGGASWSALGAPSVAASRLLAADASTRVRFVPTADWNGVASLTLRAWDRTTGVAGATADTTVNGGSSAFSSSQAASTITVAAVNDSPSLTLGAAPVVAEDAGPQTVTGFAAAAPGGGADEAAQTFTYLVNNSNNALFSTQPSISSNGTLTFTSAANASGTATVTVAVRDSGGTANGGVDTSGTQTFVITVNGVNDAPVLAGANSFTGILEDPSTNDGTLVSALIAGQVSDADTGALAGIAITAADNANGAWEFSLDGGAVWSALRAPSDAASRLLAADASTRVRFVPTADWNGLATIALRAWDRTTGVAGATVDTTVNGGSSAFSSAQASSSITVAAVADAPALTVAAATGAEDVFIPLSVSASLVDTDGSETLAVFVTGIPVGATLTDGALSFTAAAGMQTADVSGWNRAALAVRPPANADDDFTLTVNALSTETGNGSSASTSAALAVTVNGIADAPNLAVTPATGNEDTAIPLGITASLADADGSESLLVTVAGVPLGATLSDGVFAFTATPGSQTATLTGWNLAALAITPPSNADTAFTLSITATATEAIGGSAATASAPLAVTVIPVNDAPVLSVGSASVDEGGILQLSQALLTATDIDTPANSLSFTLAAVSGGRIELATAPRVTISSFTMTQLAAGEVRLVQTAPGVAPSFSVAVTDGTQSSAAQLVVLTLRAAVPPAADPPAPVVQTIAALVPAAEPPGNSAGAVAVAIAAPTSPPFASAPDASATRSVMSHPQQHQAAPAQQTAEDTESLQEAGASSEAIAVAAVTSQPGAMAMTPLMASLSVPSAPVSNGGFHTTRIESATGFGGPPQPPGLPTRELASIAFAFDPVHHNPEVPDEVASFTASAGRTAGLGLSAGAVWWVLRAGGLLSSLLASAPAWRHLDPLPILGRDDEDEKVDWGDEDAEAKRQERAAQHVLATKPARRRESP